MRISCKLIIFKIDNKNSQENYKVSWTNLIVVIISILHLKLDMDKKNRRETKNLEVFTTEIYVVSTRTETDSQFMHLMKCFTKMFLNLKPNLSPNYKWFHVNWGKEAGSYVNTVPEVWLEHGQATFQFNSHHPGHPTPIRFLLC